MITACRPWLPTRAAAALTLRSPLSLLLEDQADRPPDSKPSAKMKSAWGVGVWVAVAVGVAVGVTVGVGVTVSVAVMVGVVVAEAVLVGV